MSRFYSSELQLLSTSVYHWESVSTWDYFDACDGQMITTIQQNRNHVFELLTMLYFCLNLQMLNLLLYKTISVNPGKCVPLDDSTEHSGFCITI